MVNCGDFENFKP